MQAYIILEYIYNIVYWNGLHSCFSLARAVLVKIPLGICQYSMIAVTRFDVFGAILLRVRGEFRKTVRLFKGTPLFCILKLMLLARKQ